MAQAGKEDKEIEKISFEISKNLIVPSAVVQFIWQANVDAFVGFFGKVSDMKYNSLKDKEKGANDDEKENDNNNNNNNNNNDANNPLKILENLPHFIFDGRMNNDENINNNKQNNNNNNNGKNGKNEEEEYHGYFDEKYKNSHFYSIETINVENNLTEKKGIHVIISLLINKLKSKIDNKNKNNNNEIKIINVWNEPMQVRFDVTDMEAYAGNKIEELGITNENLGINIINLLSNFNPNSDDSGLAPDADRSKLKIFIDNLPCKDELCNDNKELISDLMNTMWAIENNVVGLRHVLQWTPDVLHGIEQD